MAMSSKLILLGALAVALSACTTAIGTEDIGFGETPKYDAAVQVINPAPVYTAEGAQPGDNGDKGAHAVKRYRTDAVKPVETMETTSGSGSSGMSNSGSPQQ
jgi:hypothetical protein